VTATLGTAPATARPGPSPTVGTAHRGPARRRIGDAIVPTFAALGLVFLLVPVAYTVVFSFNSAGKTNLVWRGFTLENWQNPCGAPQVCEAFGHSLQVGVLSTLIATVLGTLLAIALVRFPFRGRSAANLLIFLPMSTPEVVLGAALLAQFLSVRLPLGFGTVVASHVLFCISFVVVTVKARVSSLDPALEEAAADLYASPLQAFWRVTFPLLLPGIAAAALLAFSLSFDDFIVTNFTSGSYETFPKFVYVSATRGIPPQANVISSFMFVLALAIVMIVQLVRHTRGTRPAPR
jgi:spermidine/putrescine transport system permease protein